MNNQTEHLTYPQAIQSLLDGNCESIQCANSHIEGAFITFNEYGELCEEGCYNEAEYSSSNWELRRAAK